MPKTILIYHELSNLGMITIFFSLFFYMVFIAIVYARIGPRET